MKKTILHIIIVLSVLGCANGIKNKEAAFDLKTDLSRFSSKLENGDSLFVLADLSACSSWWHEKNTLIKKGNKLMISTDAKGEFVDNERLDETQYIYLENDSLNFENFFQFMAVKSTEDRIINSNIVTVIYQQDTIRYYSDGLSDHLENIGYYLLIKRRIYPNVKMYQPVVIPPKPKEEIYK